MKKIPTLFQRNYETDRLVRDEVTPGCEWVLAGEGVATRKHDGTCCLIKDGNLFKRYELKPGKDAPADFIPAQEPDEITEGVPGWLPITPGDKWHQEAWSTAIDLGDGTYELVGPKINGNPDNHRFHTLVRHGVERVAGAPYTFEGLKRFLEEENIEGIVWWRNINDGNCEKVKLKKRDFGFKR